MDGETNGSQETTQGAESQAQEQQQESTQGVQEVGGSSGGDWEKQIADRDARIAELEGQVAEVKAQAESDQLDFKLQLAGVRNVKAARALLGDHDNDVNKLKEAEP